MISIEREAPINMDGIVWTVTKWTKYGFARSQFAMSGLEFFYMDRKIALRILRSRLRGAIRDCKELCLKSS